MIREACSVCGTLAVSVSSSSPSPSSGSASASSWPPFASAGSLFALFLSEAFFLFFLFFLEAVYNAASAMYLVLEG